MWWIKTRGPSPPFGTNLTDTPLSEGRKLPDPPPIKHGLFGCIIQGNHILCMTKSASGSLYEELNLANYA